MTRKKRGRTSAHRVGKESEHTGLRKKLDYLGRKKLSECIQKKNRPPENGGADYRVLHTIRRGGRNRGGGGGLK